MSVRFLLSDTDCVCISGADHHAQSQDASGLVLQRLDDPQILLPFSHEAFIALLAGPDVALKRGYFASSSVQRRLRNDLSYVASLPDAPREEIFWKESWVCTLLAAVQKGDVKRNERAIARFMPLLTERVNAAALRSQHGRAPARAGRKATLRDAPSPKSLLRWTKRYERGGATPLALLRKRRAHPLQPKTFCPEAERLITEGISTYLVRGGPSITSVVAHTKDLFEDENRARAARGAAPLILPSGRTIRRRIACLDPFEVLAQREGIEVARHKFSFYENGLPAEHALQRLEIDDWEIDLMTLLGESGALDYLSEDQRARLDVGRRWICVIIDCATRCILGFRLTKSPNTANAIETLRLATRDKSAIAEAAGCTSPWDQYGGPGAVCSDQGPSFVDIRFKTAVADLGATSEAPVAGVPKLRARIERLFRSLGMQLVPLLIGRTFSNPVARGDYPSETVAALTDDELAQIFTLFIVDIYHNTPHGGLKGETPANAWARLARTQGVTPPPDANQARVVFGHEVTRKLDRHGVRAFDINYTCPELQALLLHGRQKDIRIKLDPLDITYVSVLIGADWYVARAVSPAVWGLSLEEWEQIVRALRTHYRNEARLSESVIAEARKKIRAIDAKARALRKVMPLELSAADLDRAERHLFLGLEIGPEGSAASGGDSAVTGEVANSC
ncbi:Mu transposase C-terminal domain-containing protein [Paracoccaceae bacterium GXU_MW_L88]